MSLLDYLTAQRNERFDSASVTAYSGLVIIPSKMIYMGRKNVPQREKHRPFAKFHELDLLCCKALDAELDTNCHPDIISSTLKSIDFSSFSNNQNSGDCANSYMYLRDIIFFHEKGEKLHLHYNNCRKVKWNSTYAL